MEEDKGEGQRQEKIRSRTRSLRMRCLKGRGCEEEGGKVRKIRRHIEMKKRLEKTWIMMMEEQHEMDEKQENAEQESKETGRGESKR